MLRIVLSFMLVSALFGCTAQQVQTAQTDAQLAITAVSATCQAVNQVKSTAITVTKGGASNTVAAIAKNVDSVCGAVATIATAAQDPTTVAWLNGLGTALVAASAAQPAS